jgi:hypothetical protein
MDLPLLACQVRMAAVPALAQQQDSKVTEAQSF